MSDIKLPEQLYVTFTCEKRDTGDTRLGFMSPFGKDKAFEKRKRTQDQWAYGNVKFDSFGKGTVETWTYEPHPTTGKSDRVCKYHPLDESLYPEVLDNQLLSGFEVSKKIRRTWSSNNVVWRVSDPRGFDLEISSENMASILDCCTLINGVIQEKCIWARSGSSNILLPESSEPYKLAVKNTKRHKSSVSLRDIKIGSLVDVLAPKFHETELVYLGKQYMCYFGATVASVRVNPSDRWPKSRTDAFIPSLKEVDHRYCFVSPTTGALFSTPSPKIASVIKEPDINFDPDQYIQHKFKDNSRWASISIISKTKPTEIKKISFVPFSVEDEKKFRTELDVKFGIVVGYQGEFWSVQAVPTSRAPYYVLMKVIAKDKEIATEPRLAEVNALFGGTKSLYTIKTVEDLSECKPHWVKIEHDAGAYLNRLPTVYGVTYD